MFDEGYIEGAESYESCYDFTEQRQESIENLFQCLDGFTLPNVIRKEDITEALRNIAIPMDDKCPYDNATKELFTACICYTLYNIQKACNLEELIKNTEIIRTCVTILIICNQQYLRSKNSDIVTKLFHDIPAFYKLPDVRFLSKYQQIIFQMETTYVHPQDGNLKCILKNTNLADLLIFLNFLTRPELHCEMCDCDIHEGII